MRLIKEQVGMDRFNAEMREYLLKAFKTTVTGVLARQHGRGGSDEQRHGARARAQIGAAGTHEGTPGLTEQMASLSEQMDSLGSRISSLEGQVTSRLTGLEEQIAALMHMVRSSNATL